MEIQMWSRNWYFTRATRPTTSLQWTMVASLGEFGFRIPVLARSEGEARHKEVWDAAA